MTPDPYLETAQALAPAIIGGVLGVLHNRERPLGERAVAFVTGVTVAHYAGMALIAYFGMSPGPMADGVKFALGLFGMSIVHAMYDQIGPFWQSVRERAVGFIGGGK